MDDSVVYILNYQKINNFLVTPPNSFSETAGVSPTSELNIETAKTMI